MDEKHAPWVPQWLKEATIEAPGGALEGWRATTGQAGSRVAVAAKVNGLASTTASLDLFLPLPFDFLFRLDFSLRPSSLAGEESASL